MVVPYKIIKNCMWLKELGSPAAAVDSVIYLAGEINILSPSLLNHELIHIAQQTKDGLDTYEKNYYVVWKNIPYHKKPYEVEAYTHCDDPNYIEREYGYVMELECERNFKEQEDEIPVQLLRFHAQ